MYLVLGVDKTILNLEPMFFLRNFSRDLKMVNGIKFDYLNKEYLLAARPRVKEFLEKLSRDFILIAYSDMPKYITKAKLKMLNLNKYFKYVFGDESLVKGKKSVQIIASVLDIKPEEIIIVDNNLTNYIGVKQKLLKIKPFMIGKDLNYEFENHEDNLASVLKTLNETLAYNLDVNNVVVFVH